MFDPFGKPEFDLSNDTLQLGFTGHEHDPELGLINMRGRVYDPSLRRFLTPDPYVTEPLNPQGWSRYAYVMNDPLNYTDPSGFAMEMCIGSCVMDQISYISPRPFESVATSPPDPAIASPIGGDIIVGGPGRGPSPGGGGGPAGPDGRGNAGDYSPGQRSTGGGVDSGSHAADAGQTATTISPGTATWRDTTPSRTTPNASVTMSPSASSMADGVQLLLDGVSVALDASVAGAPFSWIPDMINAGISLVRGDALGAGLSAGAALPFLGVGANAAHAGRVGARAVPRGPGPTVDVATGQPVGRFVVDPKGNTMIEPNGGRTVPAGRGGVDTHTLYPNGSNYQRLNPQGHPGNPTPHGHGHLLGSGSGMKGQGPSIDPQGNLVPWSSADAHWPIR